MKKILVVCAHPDDELLGCGGSICKWTRQGAKAYALILAEGLTARANNANEVRSESINNLRSDAKRAAKIIGYEDIFFERFPDNRMDSVDLLDVVHIISQYVDKLNPDTILTHHHSDLNIDHRIAFQSVITACRPLCDMHVKEIYSFQIPSSTEWNFPYHKSVFSPNVFVNIEDTLEEKISAMECYNTEKRASPHPRSPHMLRSIAAQWGATSGMRCAEALELVYKVERE